MLTKYCPTRNSIVYVELYIYEAIYMNYITVMLENAIIFLIVCLLFENKHRRRWLPR